MSLLSRILYSVNGVLIAYTMAATNSLLQLLFAFGVHVTSAQQSAITAFLNAALVMIAHASHSVAKHSKGVIPAGPIDESKAAT